MAIFNTFQRCLDSPYLFEDPEAPSRAEMLLRMAEDRLSAAVALQSSSPADQTDACLFGYEAMFACLRALVYSKGYREGGMRCLILACEELFVRPGQLEPEHLVAFERAQSLKATPGEIVTAASAFVSRARELLKP